MNGEIAERKFKIYRAAEAQQMLARDRSVLQHNDVPHPETVAGVKRFAAAAGVANGATAKVIFSSPSLHISYAWFKSGFPLPVHSHDVNCFYLIVAGSMRFGAAQVGKGDGVFVPAGMPYTATPGAEGVEFIEVRTSDDYGTRYRGQTLEYWDRIVSAIEARQESWATERPPLELIPTRPERPEG